MTDHPESFVRYCTRCIFNSQVDPDIYFDRDGLCNHCMFYDEKVLPLSNQNRETAFNKLLSEIKEAGKGKKYDCIIGVSGGADSSYVAHLVKEFGLRPLAVHCDNGWNTELAVSNINNVLQGLGIDLYTHVINWEEFKDIQLAYLKASVIDIEAPSDHAIMATLYNQAVQFNVKYILSGENFSTEGYLPETWVHLKNDLVNLKAIHKRFGQLPLKTFPTLGYIKQQYYEKVKRIQYVPLLDYVPYVKTEAKQILTDKYNWRDYGGKHYESIITRFYQSYILPHKFGIDKRYSHFSTLICSGQMTRENALVEVSHPPYELKKIEEDKRYVVKKFGLTEESFDALIANPIKSHTDYPSLLNTVEQFRIFVTFFKILTGQSLTYPVKRSRSVAVLLDNTFERDYRVYLESTALAQHYDVTLFAVKDDQLPNYEIRDGVKVRRIFDEDLHRLPKRKHLHRHARAIARKGFGTIHANDHLMLDVANRIKKMSPDCKVIYDSHELFHSWPLNLNNASPYILFKSALSRRIQIWLEKKNSKSIDRLITVNGSLASDLKNHFNLNSLPVVIRNAPPLKPVQKGKHLLRRSLNIPAHQNILVYIGMHVYPKTLNVEMVMDQVSQLPNTAFILICKDDINRKAIEDYGKQKGYNSVYFHGLLRPEEMNDYLCDCDAGLVPTWNKKDLSYWYALDNKLFNYLMAGIPILATAQPEYKAIVEVYNIGVCVNPDQPDAYMSGLKTILDNSDFYLQNVDKAKRELNWEKEAETLLKLYSELIPESSRTQSPPSR